MAKIFHTNYDKKPNPAGDKSFKMLTQGWLSSCCP